MEFESVSGYHLGPTRKQLEPRNWHLQLLFVLFLKRKFHKIKFWGSKQKCFLHYRESPGSMLQNCCKLKTAAKYLLTGKNRLAVRSGLRKWRKKSFPPERDKDHKCWSPCAQLFRRCSLQRCKEVEGKVVWTHGSQMAKANPRNRLASWIKMMLLR